MPVSKLFLKDVIGYLSLSIWDGFGLVSRPVETSESVGHTGDCESWNLNEYQECGAFNFLCFSPLPCFAQKFSTSKYEGTVR